MRELSLHILDVIENSLAAGATLIHISIVDDADQNMLGITIKDNGKGIEKSSIKKVLDPFFTTRTTRRIGLGLSLFRDAAERCGGRFSITSKKNEGTEIVATFERDHIDRAPLGDSAGTLLSLVVGNPFVDFTYTHEIAGSSFFLDTRQIKKELEGVPVSHPDVVKWLGDTIRQGLVTLTDTNG